MAARQSTASRKPRTTTQTKPGSKRIKPGEKAAPKRIHNIPVFVVVGPDGDQVIFTSRAEAVGYSKSFFRLKSASGRVEERLATITAGKAPRLTEKNLFGVMVDGQLVATAPDLMVALDKRGEFPGGVVVGWLGSDTQTSKPESDEVRRRKILREYNPLAKTLAAQHQATIDAVAEHVGSVAELWEPLGQTHCEKTHGMRRATDRECRVAMLGTAQTFDINVTGDIAAQVVKKLTDYAKQLQAAADRVQAAVTAGTIAKPKAARRGKAVK